MTRVNKTENNLQKVWNDLDNACGLIENSMDSLSRMSNIPKELKNNIEFIDFSAIVGLKNEVEELLELTKNKEGKEKRIRFITTNYKELFTIKDGESIKVSYPDGIEYSAVCTYIDDTHLRFCNRVYHIREIAEVFEKNGIKVTPIL